MKIAILWSVFICGLSPSLQADDLILKDGRFIENVKVEKTAGGYNVKYKNGTVFVPESLVKDCIMEGVDGFVPRNDKEREMIEKGLVPYKGKWVTRARRVSSIKAKQAKAKAKLEELKRWHSLDCFNRMSRHQAVNK